MKRIEIIPHHAIRSHALETKLASLDDSIIGLKAASYLLDCDKGLDDGLLTRTLVDEHREDILFNAKSSFLAHEELPDVIVEVGFLPGVTDNVGQSCTELFALENLTFHGYSSRLYYLYSESLLKYSKNELEKYIKEIKGFYNPLIEVLRLYLKGGGDYDQRFENFQAPTVRLNSNLVVEKIDLAINDDELLTLSKDRCLALELNEMQVIKDHYLDANRLHERKKVGLDLMTDVELEVLAQTWSEHCKHKIFAADIEYEREGLKRTIKSLYKTYIKQATKEIDSDFLISVFSDNAGIVRFDEHIDVCIKAETHNSPSALDPYGGALTGILGVNRDIMGCGLGAKPIANTNVFCVGPQNIDELYDKKYMPKGLMAPREILKGVHAGVRDGGNKSGIPTVNGAMFFDVDYSGKPLVFCGTVGVIPPKLKDGRDSSEKGAKVGDYIYVAGGRVGADGIHGATFSSMDLNESSPATAVQIGDPITQKRVLDFLIEARDLGLFTCVTDNGAGGISSSIGEMATLTNGCVIDLAKHPVKYPGLSPWEIMISESQERMTFAVDPKHAGDFEKLAKDRNVEVSNLGHFTDTGFLSVFYKDEQVALMEMDFLHNGLPVMKLSAKHEAKVAPAHHWLDKAKSKTICNTDGELIDQLKTMLRRENIASKRQWVEQYDHEVQGATIVKPFCGKEQRAPSDSGVVSLKPHGGSDHSSLAIGCGLAPRWSAIDAKVMAKMSVDESIRNIIAQGANPAKICLLDNFCWPDPIESIKTPDGATKLAKLVECCEGLYEICVDYQTPLVSGKDSMKNDFRGVNHQGDPLTISIKPTLLVTSMGHLDDQNLCQSVLPNDEVELFIIGKDQRTLRASEYEACYGKCEGVEEFSFDHCFSTYQSLHTLMKKGLVKACHDIGEGGTLVALSEMTFDRTLSVTFNVNTNDLIRECFGEGPGQFIIACAPASCDEVQNHLNSCGVDYQRFGTSIPSQDAAIKGYQQGKEVLSANTDELRACWERKWF